jgi:UDP-4-amino-4,6-dideoxy-N-acetyl-beta-L-altrosamine N-acetyltransferase
MIDGKGRTRVVRAIESLVRSARRAKAAPPHGSATIRLRALVAEDRTRLLRWRNQPEIGAQMFTDHTITPAEHDRWFERAMRESPHAVYRVVEAGQDPIGFVSITDIEGGTCTWGGYIGALDWQGRGAGTAAIWLSLELAFTKLERDQVLVEVLSSNRRAADVYARFGFEEREGFRKVVMKSGGYSEVNGLVLSRERWAASRPSVQDSLKQRGLIQ